MDQETRYRLEKRIRELQREVDRLRPYRETALEIYDGLVEQVGKGQGIGISWLLGRFKWLLK